MKYFAYCPNCRMFWKRFKSFWTRTTNGPTEDIEPKVKICIACKKGGANKK